MGGEWNFSLVGDPATIDVKKYQQELLKIRQRYQHDPELRNTVWCKLTGTVTEPPDNIFAKFTYKCERHDNILNWHKGEPGAQDSRNAWWVLYWDPSKFEKKFNLWGDTYARCSPKEFIYKSVTMQRHLAINFPEHFQVYLGDEIDGYGDRELYWGVKPQHLDHSDDSDDSDGFERTDDDMQEYEWFLEKSI